MNKLLIFPLGLMFVLTMFSVMWSGPGPQYNATYTPQNSTETYEFNIWNGVGGILVLLGVAIAVATVSGFHLLGSGFSTESQRMIFQSVLFLGLWTALTIVTSQILFLNPLIILFWAILSIMYVIGFGIQVTSTQAA